ncbi:MAG: transcription-repair coupling factor [Treponema sp.]|jgi:transcription-repair coupling factor (superfamily II helicase)|nr:transcription-repair coupling factor [Treponema sp.]
MSTLSLPAPQGGITASSAVAACISAFKGRKFPFEIEGVEGALGALLMAEFAAAAGGLFVAVVPGEMEAADLIRDLGAAGVEAEPFPWWGTAPYREGPSPRAVFGERMKALSAMAVRPASGGGRVVVVPQRAFLTPLPPPEYVRGLLVPVRTGGAIDTAALARRLTDYGYIRVPRVQMHGEFALRGEALDSHLGGDEEAYRILFDFDRVETIRRFDPLDQSGHERVDAFFVRPLRELIWTDDRIETLSDNLAALGEFRNDGREIIEELVTRQMISGEELLFPLAFKKAASLCDYLDREDTVFFIGQERLFNAQEIILREYRSLYGQASRRLGSTKGERGGAPVSRAAASRGAPGGLPELPLPERILLDIKELFEKPARRISFVNFRGGDGGGALRLRIPCDPPSSFFGNINYLKEEAAALLGQGWNIVVAAESEVQAERIRQIFTRPAPEEGGGGPPHAPSAPRPLPVAVISAPLSAGFSLPDCRLMVIQENEIFGRRKRPPRSLRTVRSSPIDTFVELDPGDFVVHVHYGIGLFRGIERIKALGHERDYVKLEYQDGEVVFVPIEQVNLVQRYIGNEGQPPRPDKLGSRNWENRKGRVRKSVEEIAEKLVTLYSKRKRAQGYAFPADTEWQTMFEAAFPFEETEDQLRCVEEIKEDMESPHPMDRLVCGDVGYGKTEVAVRACFKAIMGGKQVAFLAPTTILAEQHYENFQERFSLFPVRLAMLSRFVGRRKAGTIVKQLSSGEIDILVGTHRILQKDVVFRNLGLMVIDEEQRFGVRDKEWLKEMKTSVDCLSLSATPIPRTLHMSLLKIRDMSLLATPPQNRHPIETVIGEFDEEKLAAAVRREVERGGQVFFLHNRVESLRETRIQLERLLPEMLVETAHGQMDARDLEDVMHRFIHGGFHILVSTTIIENGIDIPNVNTIIIDRADMYGVSQLYQLRGRVGRSDRVAYAYLFYPGNRTLTELAMKRLQVISDLTELGSGFKIAMKDMEIRGAGNLLGREQSGNIYSVGFDLYIRLLDEAVRRLEDSSYEAETEPLLELEYSGFIPDNYIDSPQEKMEVYKKIAAVRDRDELDRLYGELLDRFGPLPDEAASLLALAEIRIICREIAVSSLREREGLVRVEFGRVSRVKVDALVRLMQESAGRVRLNPRFPNVLELATGTIGLKEKSEFIREKLAALAG